MWRPKCTWILILLMVISECNWSEETPSAAVDFEEEEDDDEFRPTNINSNLDAALDELWPMVVKNGMDKMKLPDIETDFSYKPLFINYNAALFLNNGLAWNIRSVARAGNAFMNLHQKTLQVSGNVQIERVDFTYDFKAQALGLVSMVGTVVGHVERTIVFGLFSINLNETDVKLDDMQIVSFGNMVVQLKSNALLRWLSEPVVGMITQLLQSRIKISISDGVREYAKRLLIDINQHDRLHIKRYIKYILPLIGMKKNEGV